MARIRKSGAARAPRSLRLMAGRPVQPRKRNLPATPSGSRCRPAMPTTPGTASSEAAARPDHPRQHIAPDLVGAEEDVRPKAPAAPRPSPFRSGRDRQERARRCQEVHEERQPGGCRPKSAALVLAELAGQMRFWRGGAAPRQGRLRIAGSVLIGPSCAVEDAVGHIGEDVHEDERDPGAQHACPAPPRSRG